MVIEDVVKFLALSQVLYIQELTELRFFENGYISAFGVVVRLYSFAGENWAIFVF